MNHIKTYCVLLLIIVFFESKAQSGHTQLFRFLEPIENIEIPPHVVSYSKVDVNFEELRDFPESLEIILPDRSTIIVPTKSFITREGYMMTPQVHQFL